MIMSRLIRQLCGLELMRTIGNIHTDACVYFCLKRAIVS